MQRQVLTAARVANAAAYAGSRSSRSASSAAGGQSVLAMAYQFIFRRNVTYATYIIGGALVLEGVYGGLTDGLWTSINKGRTFETADWTKFKVEDESE